MYCTEHVINYNRKPSDNVLNRDINWRELSVSGDIYELRKTRSHAQKGHFCPDEDNILRDGTLIDLCGATLLWRSSQSIQNCPKSEDIGR